MSLIQLDRWEVDHLRLSWEKVDQLWQMLRKRKTLFSDLTRDDFLNFVQAISSPNSVWLEVREQGVVVGLIYFSEMHKVVDCTGHMVFFDRRPAEKLDLCRAVVKWMFDSFPLHRMTVTPPVVYHATSRLLGRLGFTREGSMRQAVLLGGKWIDQLIFGITREEVEAQCLFSWARMNNSVAQTQQAKTSGASLSAT
jgi:RimJ/RimL family protein N-acetyltransferase